MNGKVLIVVLLAGASTAHGQDTSRPARAFKTTVKGDLDTVASARGLSEALELATAQDAWALVELSAAAADPKVAHEWVRIAKSRSCKLLVRVSPPARGAANAPACLALALLADGACIGEDVRFETSADLSISSGKPDAASEVIATELAEWMATGLKARGLDPGLGAVLFAASGKAFLAPDGHLIDLSGLPPETSPADGVQVLGDRGVAFDRAAINRLSLQPCEDPRSILRAMGIQSVKVVEDSEVLAGKQEVADAVKEILTGTRALLDLMEKELNLPDPEQHQISAQTYRSAADRSLQRAELAQNQLSGAERLIRETPEMLKTLPPGEPAIAEPGRSYAAGWRSLIKARRSDLERLRQKAETFAKLE
ncbi:MAG: hypothetical protein ACOYN0_05000 [Phycisphaerales bacterium]